MPVVGMVGVLGNFGAILILDPWSLILDPWSLPGADAGGWNGGRARQLWSDPDPDAAGDEVHLPSLPPHHLHRWRHLRRHSYRGHPGESRFMSRRKIGIKPEDHPPSPAFVWLLKSSQCLMVPKMQRWDLDINNQIFIVLFPYVWNPFKNILMTFKKFLMVSILHPS